MDMSQPAFYRPARMRLEGQLPPDLMRKCGSWFYMGQLQPLSQPHRALHPATHPAAPRPAPSHPPSRTAPCTQPPTQPHSALLTCRLKMGVFAYGAAPSSPEWIASTMARVYLRLMRLPTPYLGAQDVQVSGEVWGVGVGLGIRGVGCREAL